jgi:hypothetical protein
LGAPGDAVLVEAWSACSSLVPSTLPLAPLWGVLLWWVPFDDHFHNYKHLRELRHLLGLDGYTVEESILIRGNCLFSWEDKVGKELPLPGGGGPELERLLGEELKKEQ